MVKNSRNNSSTCSTVNTPKHQTHVWGCVVKLHCRNCKYNGYALITSSGNGNINKEKLQNTKDDNNW